MLKVINSMIKNGCENIDAYCPLVNCLGGALLSQNPPFMAPHFMEPHAKNGTP